MTEPETPWLSPAELSAWIPLHGMLVALPAALDAQLQRDFGMSLYSYGVMAALSDAPDRTLRMTELAAWTHGSLPRLSYAVTVLERSGWVVRSPTPSGRRAVLATLTDAGVARMQQIAPAHVATVRRLVVDVLSAGEFDALGRTARTVLTGLVGADTMARFTPPPLT